MAGENTNSDYGFTLADFAAAAKRAMANVALGGIPSIASGIRRVIDASSGEPPELPVNETPFPPGLVDSHRALGALGLPEGLLQFHRQLYLAALQRTKELAGVGPARGAAANPWDLVSPIYNLTGEGPADMLRRSSSAPTTLGDLLNR